MSIAAQLDQAVRAVCPIYGVSIGTNDDKATWRIDYMPTATAQQKTAAQGVVAGFDPVAAGVPLDISDINNLDKALKALALLTRQYANALQGGTYIAKTVADTRGDFMTIYRALP